MTQERAAHPYTFGLEEEYFLVRRNGRRLRHMPRRFFDACRAALGERFGSEMLQTQVEVQTAVHDDPRIGDVRASEYPGVDAQEGQPTERPHEHDVVIGAS